MSEPSTSQTLIARARALDPRAWQRLVDLYYPLVYRWCRGAGLQDWDAGDVCQEVFSGVATNLEQYRCELRFRPWLRGVTRNKLRLFWQRVGQEVGGRGGSGSLDDIEDPQRADLGESPDEEQDEDALVVQKALGFIRPEFREETWQAFWQTAVENRSPADVAADLGLTRNAVYVAKSRVLARLRFELDELFE